MKNKISTKRNILLQSVTYLVMVCAFCFSLVVTAQNPEKDTKEIEQTVSELYKAMVERNQDVLQALTLEKLTYGHSSGTIENKTEYVNGVLNGAFQFSKIFPEDQTIIISDNIGVVRHLFVAEGTNNGKPAEVKIGCLLIFKKEGSWKLLARQAFKL